MIMETKTRDLSLNCVMSTENNLNKTEKTKKKRGYIIVTLFHGGCLKFEKHVIDVDAKGIANLTFNDVNVETAYLRIQVFSHRKLLSYKHVGDVNALVYDLVDLVGGQPSSSTTYELGKTSEKNKKHGSLKVSCTVSKDNVRESPSAVSSHGTTEEEEEPKRLATAIGNDIALFKTLPSFRTPLVSFDWN